MKKVIMFILGFIMGVIFLSVWACLYIGGKSDNQDFKK